MKQKQAPEWRAWWDMISRCDNCANREYRNYGGRGITVCVEWKSSYQAFLNYIGPRPSNRFSLDRIDVNGGYAPGNVRWATVEQQTNNTRRTRRINYQNVEMSLTQWANELKINPRTLAARLFTYGWTIERAFTAEVDAVKNWRKSEATT